jgi:hypothetical protein
MEPIPPPLTLCAPPEEIEREENGAHGKFIDSRIDVQNSFFPCAPYFQCKNAALSTLLAQLGTESALRLGVSLLRIVVSVMRVGRESWSRRSARFAILITPIPRTLQSFLEG